MMKFITEEYLRDLYREKPFDTYKLQKGQRLTPGATEYLYDKRIKLSDDSKVNNSVSQKILKEEPKEISKQIKEDDEKNSDTNLNKQLCFKLKSMEAKFLETSSEILKEDVILAQNVINLRRKISNIRNALNGKSTFEPISYTECEKINSSNLKIELDDCFEITEFHMQLEKSVSIFKMHILRCELRELQFEITEIYINDNEVLKNKVIENINFTINSLSQLICLAVGGKQCQRKI